MARKRRRSSFTAASDAVTQHYPRCNTPPREADGTIHIRVPSATAALSTPSVVPDSSTPLILRAADVRSMQNALGLTPETPAHSTIYLPPDAERHARALLTPQHNERTPVDPLRRLSDVSAVTPIPLPVHLATPERSSPQDTPPRPQQPAFHEHDHEHHSPITPHAFSNVRNLSPPPTPRIVRTIEPRAIFAPPDTSGKAGTIKPPPALFSTGSGKPLPVLPVLPNIAKAGISTVGFTTAKGTRLSAPEQSPPPFLFTTGKGKPLPVQLPGAHNVAPVNHPTRTPPNFLPLHPHPPMFSGAAPIQHPPPSGATDPPTTNFQYTIPVTTPSPHTPAAQLLFTSAAGKPIAMPLVAKSIPVRPPPSPHTPFQNIGGLRKVLFSDSRNSSASRTPAQRFHNVDTPIRLPGTGRAGTKRFRSSPATRVTTTPFRTPRQMPKRRKKNAKVNTAPTVPVPKYAVPKIGKDGVLRCNAPNHNRHAGEKTNAPLTVVSQFLTSPYCLEKCLEVSFKKAHFGSAACLPPEIQTQLQLEGRDTFSVSNCLQWMKELFPNSVKKAVSCVGSPAWTKMAYSLAVWKLARLAYAGTSAPGPFLTAANVIREFLRRLEREWHKSKQSHLLRIMRNDSSPASHVVLNICGLRLGGDQTVNLLVTDGWYVAYAVGDELVQKRIWSGKMVVGQKISVIGGALLKRPLPQPFFFGDADELGSSVLRISLNGVRRVEKEGFRLGIHRPPRARSLRYIRDDAGSPPAVAAVILKSYPVFYMEKITSSDADGEEMVNFIRRREEGEDEAREEHAAKHRRELAKGTENEKAEDPDPRDVRCVQDLLVCGIDDNPEDVTIRRNIRIYNVSEGLRSLLCTEGKLLLLSHIWPKKNGWTCKPDSIRELRCGKTMTVIPALSRKICSISKLRTGDVPEGAEFDGVFCVLYTTESDKNSSQRFVYLTDKVHGEKISVLALQLCESDTSCLPRALRFKRSHSKFPLIGLKDAEFCSLGERFDLVHAKATLRTSITSSRGITRQDGSQLSNIHGQVQSQLLGKSAKLEQLRNAVESFATGKRESIGAYFTDTPDILGS